MEPSKWAATITNNKRVLAEFTKQEDAVRQSAVSASGVPVGADGLPAGGGSESVVNTAAIDVLRRLPGVTEANFRPLMAAAGSLAGLAELPGEKLAEIMGSQASARKLRDWLDAVCPIQR